VTRRPAPLHQGPRLLFIGGLGLLAVGIAFHDPQANRLGTALTAAGLVGLVAAAVMEST
jgi:hypothetical protein